ncbi:MAG: O-antigen ligase family protein, partial [Chloroflexota bacterium]
RLLTRYRGLSERARLFGTLFAAGLVTLTGWLTWGEQAAGVYRRLGDVGQLALTAAAASLFYVAPVFIIYLLALALLLFFVYARPAWGLAIVAFFFPFYVRTKPTGGYAFSPVEVFVLVTAVATALSYAGRLRRELAARYQEKRDAPSLLLRWRALREQLRAADYAAAFFVLVATVSLLFTERLDVATNEWRMVIVEPVLFYALLRLIGPSTKEMWRIVDAFVLGGIVVAVYGLWQYALGQNVVTVAGGLARLSSVYGSPNNVALYLGRVLPFLFAVALFGLRSPLRRFLYGLALVPVGIALILTFSKGGLFLGVPAAIGLVLLLWLHSTRRPIWPWIAGGLLLAAAAAVIVFSVPALAQRLDLQGTTSVLRLSLWQASLNMFAENPLFGVGLDNFLYAYRGRYILDSGWEEPYLNHPHNIVLDFATRLGLAGLIAGVWLFAVLLRNLWHLRGRLDAEWRPVAVAIAGAVAQLLAHGIVDHSLFLVDLSFAFFFLLGLAVWLRTNRETIGRQPG